MVESFDATQCMQEDGFGNGKRGSFAEPTYPVPHSQPRQSGHYFSEVLGSDGE